MRHDIVGERATFEKGYCYQEGIAIRQRVFPDGQVEVTGFPSTDWSRCAHMRTLPKAKRGKSEHRERNIDAASRRARQSLRLKAKTIQADHMLTLSTRENIQDLDRFQELFDRWRRIMGAVKAFAYVAVPERQTRGAWHLHVAVHGKPARWRAIRAWLRVVGGKGNGYVHLREPEGGHYGQAWQPHQLSAYISKYIGKDVGVAELNRKRYWTSRGIVVVPRADYCTWMGYPSMYEVLKLVMADLHAQFGVHDIVAKVSARDGSFFLSTGPRPQHAFCPPSPFVTEYERFLGSRS
ncbi:hypothetical protein [Ralstonia sp.]|uniref:rolling circle replication-associated protein n=1 Tax=Ralstonia sp. TaxID=54061 RepID=UPI0031E1B4DB